MAAVLALSEKNIVHAIIIKSHHIHTDRVESWNGLSLSLTVSRAKTAEVIKVLFGGEDICITAIM